MIKYLGKSLICFLFCFHLTSAGFHTLQYISTGITADVNNLPEYTLVGLIDSEPFVYYDSNIKKMVPRAYWTEKIEDENYWDIETQKQQNVQEVFIINMAILKERFNQTKGVHTVQRMYGCELDDDGNTRGFFDFGYDGEDFLSLDMSTLTWTAANPKAVMTKHKWDNLGDAKHRKAYLNNKCIDYLKRYVGYGRDTLERRVRPEVSLFQKDSSSPVVCHATGFFPKEIEILWQKNGQDLYEDVDLRETLPNQDGNFQKRSFLNVSPEELNKNKYKCVVHHSSLKEDIVLNSSDPTLLNGGNSMEIIIVAVVAVLLVIIVVFFGVLICKKQKSGFRPVSTNATSDGDTTS